MYLKKNIVIIDANLFMVTNIEDERKQATFSIYDAIFCLF